MSDLRPIPSHQRVYLPALAAACLLVPAGCRESRQPTEVRPAVASAMVGRSQAPAAMPASPGWVVPADDRAALVRLTSGQGAGEGVPAQVAVRVGDAPAAPSPVWWLSPAEGVGGGGGERPGSPESRMSRWMGEPVAWSAVPASALVGPSPSGGVALLALPVGTGVGALGGSEVEIAGVAAPIRWLPAPSGVFNFASPAPGPGTRAPYRRSLRAALSGAAAHPWSAWRASLALRGGPTPIDRAPADRPVDSVAARLADQHAAIWTIAFQRLARADRDAARRLALRLGGAIDFGGGVVAPVWTNWPGPRVAGNGLELLLADLLAEDLTDRERALRVRAWLQALPTAAAWVTDDAGLRHGLGSEAISACTVMLVNLTEDSQAASISIEGSATPIEMLTIKPMSAASVSVAPARAARMAGPPFPLDIRIGDWRGRATALAGPIPAAPPGVPLGPLLADVTMGHVAACAAAGQMPAVTEPLDSATVGMLHRRATDGSSGADDSGWVVYLEALCPPGSSAGDTVRIAFGPPGTPSAEWVIPRQGTPVLHRASAGEVRRSVEADRWRIWAPVPRAAIERGASGAGESAAAARQPPGQRLRLGVVRVRQRPDGSEQRSAWPRPLVPWQDDPGRIDVDLGSWNAGEGRP